MNRILIMGGDVLMAERIPNEIVKQISQSVDIVEVISNFVHLKNRAAITSGFVRFTMKNLLLFPYHLISKYIIVSVAVREEMFFLS